MRKEEDMDAEGEKSKVEGKVAGEREVEGREEQVKESVKPEIGSFCMPYTKAVDTGQVQIFLGK